jgi:hypothetical protein
LKSYGINGNLWAGIQAFLTGRTQQTRVGHHLLRTSQILRGVVQGSVFDPLLFLLFINDLSEQLCDARCKCKLYADDVKLYISFSLSDIDYSVIQKKLDAAHTWADRWQLKIKYAKCNVLIVGRDRVPVPCLHINGLAIASASCVRDLGILVDRNMSFSTYVSKVVCKAFARVNLVIKCFLSRDIVTLVRAYTTYVRPLVEYATFCWSPHQVAAIKQLESVQREFTKRLPGLSSMTYGERLARTGLESLELRRLKQDLIHVNKILFGHIDVDPCEFFVLSSSHCNTRGH